MFKRGIYWLTALVLMLWLFAYPKVARAESVAMITDIAGVITEPAASAKTINTILAEIEANTRLQLADAAQLVVIYLGSGSEYTMRGPALIEFRSSEPVAINGAQPVRRASPLAARGAAVRIRPVGVTQAVLVMRSARPAARIRLLNLSGTQTLETQAEFRWQAPQPALKYQFELIDDTGRTLHEAQLETTTLRLPASVQLIEGVPYTWVVSARLPDGRKYSNAGDFRVAPANLRVQVEALRPAVSAPLSTRVAYAAWLDQMELKDEARKYWRALSAERPEDARLKALAGE
ncbi:MAG TPA: hypothetical protein VGQ54_07545 [Burkholderiales bacterium]|nr:hypothetical protein [Burkholderiales bacterium]